MAGLIDIKDTDYWSKYRYIKNTTRPTVIFNTLIRVRSTSDKYITAADIRSLVKSKYSYSIGTKDILDIVKLLAEASKTFTDETVLYMHKGKFHIRMPELFLNLPRNIVEFMIMEYNDNINHLYDWPNNHYGDYKLSWNQFDKNIYILLKQVYERYDFTPNDLISLKWLATNILTIAKERREKIIAFCERNNQNDSFVRLHKCKSDNIIQMNIPLVEKSTNMNKQSTILQN